MKSHELDTPDLERQDLSAFDRLARATAVTLSRRRFLGGTLGGGALVLLSRLGGNNRTAEAYPIDCNQCCVGYCTTCESCFNGSCTSPHGFSSATNFCCACPGCQPLCQYCTCSTFEACYTVCDDGSTSMDCPACYV